MSIMPVLRDLSLVGKLQPALAVISPAKLRPGLERDHAVYTAFEPRSCTMRAGLCVQGQG